MNEMVLPLLLIVANVMGTGMIVPQVVRLRRRGVGDGVSGIWVGVGVALNSWWVLYAVQAPVWGILPVSVAGVSLYSVLALLYSEIVGRRAYRSLALGAFGLGMVPLPFLVVQGWSAAGLAIGLSYGLQFGPAAISAIRSVDVAGISTTTWVMAWIEAAIWLVYGAAIGDPALLVGGGGGALMALIILVRLLVGTERPRAVDGHGTRGLGSGDGPHVHHPNPVRLADGVVDGQNGDGSVVVGCRDVD